MSAKREDTGFGIRVTLRLQKKRTIAAAVLTLQKSGMAIFLDAGSTSMIMAETLVAPQGLTDLSLITNPVDVAVVAVIMLASAERVSPPAPASKAAARLQCRRNAAPTPAVPAASAPRWGYRGQRSW